MKAASVPAGLAAELRQALPEFAQRCIYTLGLAEEYSRGLDESGESAQPVGIDPLRLYGVIDSTHLAAYQAAVEQAIKDGDTSFIPVLVLTGLLTRTAFCFASLQDPRELAQLPAATADEIRAELESAAGWLAG